MNRPLMKEEDRMLQRFLDNLDQKGIFICTWGGSLVYEHLSAWLGEYGEGAAELDKKKRKGKAESIVIFTKQNR